METFETLGSNKSSLDQVELATARVEALENDIHHIVQQSPVSYQSVRYVTRLPKLNSLLILCMMWDEQDHPNVAVGKR